MTYDTSQIIWGVKKMDRILTDTYASDPHSQARLAYAANIGCETLTALLDNHDFKETIRQCFNPNAREWLDPSRPNVSDILGDDDALESFFNAERELFHRCGWEEQADRIVDECIALVSQIREGNQYPEEQQILKSLFGLKDRTCALTSKMYSQEASVIQRKRIKDTLVGVGLGIAGPAVIGANVTWFAASGGGSTPISIASGIFGGELIKRAWIRIEDVVFKAES